MLKKINLWLFVFTAIVATHTIAHAQFLGPMQVEKLPSTPADHRIQYGKDSLQFGDLRRPKTKGKHPVAVVIHGGCWKSTIGNLKSTAALSSALTTAGVATWNIEYRSVDNAGGGWPGTFNDVANAVDYLSVLAKSYPLDLKRVIVMGHSAGGHLATWVAARHRLPKSSPLFSKNPLSLRAVISLAGIVDLEGFVPLDRMICGDPVIAKLVGGSPTEVAQRYQEASPINLLPIRTKQVLIFAAQDPAVPPAMGKKYEGDAKQQGDDVTLIVVENASHFELIAPGSVAWPIVEKTALSLLRVTKVVAK